MSKFIKKYTCILTIYDKMCVSRLPTVADIFFYSKTYKSLPRQVIEGKKKRLTFSGSEI